MRRHGYWATGVAGQQEQPQLVSLHWHSEGGQLHVQVLQQVVLFASVFGFVIVVFLVAQIALSRMLTRQVLEPYSESMSDLTEPRPLSPEAVSVLLGAHRNFLRFLEKRVESREAAEDILQSAFVKGLDRGADIADEKVVAWFYRVLRNAVIDHYRHRAVSSKAMEVWKRDFGEYETARRDIEQEICGCVGTLVEGLKPEYAQALEIVDLREGKLADLAAQAGITAENAAVRLHRARKALRTQVERACGTCSEHGCLDCTCQRPTVN